MIRLNGSCIELEWRNRTSADVAEQDKQLSTFCSGALSGTLSGTHSRHNCYNRQAKEAGGRAASDGAEWAPNMVEIDSKDNDVRTPLSRAAERGREAVVKLLLEMGKVEVDSKDNDGRTPLSQAAERGREVGVKLLRSYPNLY